ncbi:MAG: DUF3293 domain-containing protein [Saprospirales bacterium]|nr:DUF3293 domain-containing protein [Saprospirales bacterium]
MAKPVVIIKSMEDYPAELDRTLVAAYLRAIYRILAPPADVQVGSSQPLLEQQPAYRSAQTFAFLTAANPGSAVLTGPENAARQAALLEALLPLTPLQPAPAVHLSPEDDWPPEPAWWAPGLAASDAVRLARSFGQNALVFGARAAKSNYGG